MSGFSNETGWRILHLDAAELAERLAKGLERAPDGRKVIGGQLVTASRVRAAAARLRALAEDEATLPPPGFSGGVLTDGNRPYAAEDLARELARQVLHDPAGDA